MKKKELEKRLKALGANLISQGGGHEKWQSKSGKRFMVPRHNEIKRKYSKGDHQTSQRIRRKGRNPLDTIMEKYFAIFEKAKEGGFCVRFPDVPGALTQGETIEEALEMAVDALCGIMVDGRKGRDYQAPRSFEEVEKEAGAGDYVFPVSPDEKVMETYRPKKRVNIMFPVDVLERVDKQVKELGNTDRSNWLSTAAEKMLAAE